MNSSPLNLGIVGSSGSSLLYVFFLARHEVLVVIQYRWPSCVMGGVKFVMEVLRARGKQLSNNGLPPSRLFCQNNNEEKFGV